MGQIAGFRTPDPTLAVAALPPAGYVPVNTRAFVNDADTPVFGDVVVGGGAAYVPVYFDGADWRVG